MEWWFAVQGGYNACYCIDKIHCYFAVYIPVVVFIMLYKVAPNCSVDKISLIIQFKRQLLNSNVCGAFY